MEKTIVFPSGGQVRQIWDVPAWTVLEEMDANHAILITDENIHHCHPGLFNGFKTIIIPAGETSKKFETIDYLTGQLISLGANRKSTLIGIGGGVITDITGFAGTVFMRGIPFGFIPTTLLAMVDAAIGGKNGINTGNYKNMIGTVRQPSFIATDTTLLSSLPGTEWSNGFAEVIKYALLFDAYMYKKLSINDIRFYKNNVTELAAIVNKCASLKNKIVVADEYETGVRKLLNFGHTLAHAIEKQYELPHGQAVAIGMVFACMLSESITRLPHHTTESLVNLLGNYGLPGFAEVDISATLKILAADKKRTINGIEYILLKDIENPVIMPLSLEIIEKALINYAGHH